jgi:hypothetical protein
MNDETNEAREFLHKKADAFFLLGTKVHISYKNGNWKRGIIKDVRPEFFLLDESLEGLQPIFFEEIDTIEAYTPKKEGVK